MVIYMEKKRKDIQPGEKEIGNDNQGASENELEELFEQLSESDEDDGVYRLNTLSYDDPKGEEKQQKKKETKQKRLGMIKKQQIMLFINRRGYAGFVSCRSCGKAIKCPHCDVGLTLHDNKHLRCHYCGYDIPMPQTCPECGSKMPQNKFCPECGNKVSENSKFCPECGHKLN